VKIQEANMNLFLLLGRDEIMSRGSKAVNRPL
jgi:hypothetical protein